MLFESHDEPIAPFRVFVKRLVVSICLGIVVIISGLAIGIAGLSHFENINFNDAFLNSALILADMGPAHPPLSEAGKIFVGIYSLFSGLVFVSIVGVIFAPVIHRFFHEFHHKKTNNKE